MNKLSTGDDSTLGGYRRLACVFFGKNSEAVRFLDKKIMESKSGADEQVIANEAQMIELLCEMTLSRKS